MQYSTTTTLAILIAVAQARFGQEQLPIAQIRGVKTNAPSGTADTLAGQAITPLLAASNPCDKLIMGDIILSQLGTDPTVIAAARNYVAAEQNFNPFVVNKPNICSDANLPSNPLLRGVTPLIDPAVAGSADANKLSAQSQKNPSPADGQSVADVLKAQGFSNFTAVNSGTAKLKDPSPAVGTGDATSTAGASQASATQGVSSTKDNQNGSNVNNNGNNNTGENNGGNNNSSLEQGTGQASQNVQTFQGKLGGTAPPVIESSNSDRPFSVNGATFVQLGAACQRSCDVQHNACADDANKSRSAGFSVSDCDAQQKACSTEACSGSGSGAASTGNQGQNQQSQSQQSQSQQSQSQQNQNKQNQKENQDQSGNAQGTNVNNFTGSLGSAPIPVIDNGPNAERRFSVNGDTFLQIGAACQRACDVQKNACANKANGDKTAGISVGQCDNQRGQCASTCGSGVSGKVRRHARSWL